MVPGPRCSFALPAFPPPLLRCTLVSVSSVVPGRQGEGGRSPRSPRSPSRGGHSRRRPGNPGQVARRPGRAAARSAVGGKDRARAEDRERRGGLSGARGRRSPRRRRRRAAVRRGGVRPDRGSPRALAPGQRGGDAARPGRGCLRGVRRLLVCAATPRDGGRAVALGATEGAAHRRRARVEVRGVLRRDGRLDARGLGRKGRFADGRRLTCIRDAAARSAP